MYYLQSRYYNPELCRFISADDPSYHRDFSNITAANLYVYANNDPIKYTDYDGRDVSSPYPGYYIQYNPSCYDENVKSIQQQLVNVYSYDLEVDGYFGPMTQAAVIDFQDNHPECGGSDGIVGPKTWAVLFYVEVPDDEDQDQTIHPIKPNPNTPTTPTTPTSPIDPAGHNPGQYDYPGGKVNNSYSGIYNPVAYLEGRYGGTITEKTRKILNLRNFVMTDINNGDLICSKAAVTRILLYYANIYKKIPNNLTEIYNRVRSFDTHDSTDPWYIDNLAQNTLRAYGYSNASSWNIYVWSFNGEVKNEINSGYPVILSMNNGYYYDHTVTVIGYVIYNRQYKNWFGITCNVEYPIIVVYDGWYDQYMYIDYNAFHFIGYFTKIRVNG